MKKIPTIYCRDPVNRSKLTQVAHPDCMWVFNGEGVATQKIDGTCCLIKNGVLYKRREVKGDKPFPGGFIVVEWDSTTRKHVGWIKVDPDDPGDKWHMEAFTRPGAHFPDGTYELCGPKIQGNAEQHGMHILLQHDMATQFQGAPVCSQHDLAQWLRDYNIEGLVWHHPDGRMAKIKKKDLDLPRKPVS